MTSGRNAHIVRLPGKQHIKKDFSTTERVVGCEGAMCSLDTFVRLYGQRLPDDMDEECQSGRFKRKPKELE